MPFGILSCYCVLFFSCCIAIEAKIVYLNGTEVAEDNLKVVNVTTSQPVQRWFSVFNPRNISNHSGTKTKSNLHTLNRKHDQEEQDEAIIEEENNYSANSSLATRSARQLRLFYMQRLLNGLHLLALLGGIYLMIFVVEPVAVPQQYLEQHYYGLPWSADRRNGLHKEILGNLPFLQRKNSHAESLDAHKRKQWILNDNPKNPRPSMQFQHHGIPTQKEKETNNRPVHRKNNSSALTGTSRVRYVSSQNLRIKSNTTTRGEIESWSKWIPPRNSTNEFRPKNKVLSNWSPSRGAIQRSDSEGKNAEKKVFNSTGSASSIRLTEIFH